MIANKSSLGIDSFESKDLPKICRPRKATLASHHQWDDMRPTVTKLLIKSSIRLYGIGGTCTSRGKAGIKRISSGNNEGSESLLIWGK